MEREYEVVIGLGSSIGNRRTNISLALGLLAANFNVVAHSLVYQSLPLGAAKGVFLNSAVRLFTSLSPFEILSFCKQLEQYLGRTKGSRWADRCIDLDILLYEDRFIKTDILTIPHKELLNRRFVLLPTIEIAGDFWHPVINKKMSDINDIPLWPCWLNGALSVASFRRTR